MGLDLVIENGPADLVLGFVRAQGVRVAPTPPSLAAAMDEALRGREGCELPRPEARAAVRALLRQGGFKPTGRNKPASEYLAQAAAAGRFPRINNVVDALNLVSLESGLPISLVDEDKARGEAPGLVVRVGTEGEAFVFNASGQVIDVTGLLSLARAGGAAIANPVKDSLATKTDARTTRVLALLYGTRRIWSPVDVRDQASRLGALLAEHAQAERVEVDVAEATPRSP